MEQYLINQEQINPKNIITLEDNQDNIIYTTNFIDNISKKVKKKSSKELLKFQPLNLLLRHSGNNNIDNKIKITPNKIVKVNFENENSKIKSFLNKFINKPNDYIKNNLQDNNSFLKNPEIYNNFDNNILGNSVRSQISLINFDRNKEDISSTRFLNKKNNKDLISPKNLNNLKEINKRNSENLLILKDNLLKKKFNPIKNEELSIKESPYLYLKKLSSIEDIHLKNKEILKNDLLNTRDEKQSFFLD